MNKATDLQERYRTHTRLKARLEELGGRFHGPHVEHISMPEREFWKFIDEILDNKI